MMCFKQGWRLAVVVIGIGKGGEMIKRGAVRGARVLIHTHIYTARLKEGGVGGVDRYRCHGYCPTRALCVYVLNIV